MPNMQEKVCPEHPDTAAVSRCVACFKPLCEACIREVKGEHFCSDTCARNHLTTDAHVSSVLARDRRRRFWVRLRNRAVLLLLVVLAAGAYVYYRNHRDRVNETLRHGQRELESIKGRVEQKLDERKNEGVDLD